MKSCLRSVPKRFRNGEGLLQCPAMAWDERMKDFHARRATARGMGGPETAIEAPSSITTKSERQAFQVGSP